MLAEVGVVAGILMGDGPEVEFLMEEVSDVAVGHSRSVAALVDAAGRCPETKVGLSLEVVEALGWHCHKLLGTGQHPLDSSRIRRSCPPES
jgi:hypothetical protein